MLYTFYRITINNENYIGSTKDFNQRKTSHKNNCYNTKTRKYNYKVYYYIREHGGWDFCEMCPIEELDCETVTQALIREEFWRKDYNALLNGKKAYQTEEEFLIQKKLNSAIYNPINNPINNAKRKLNIFTCSCGSSFQSCRKEQHFKSQKHQKFVINVPPIEILIE